MPASNLDPAYIEWSRPHGYNPDTTAVPSNRARLPSQPHHFSRATLLTCALADNIKKLSIKLNMLLSTSCYTCFRRTHQHRNLGWRRRGTREDNAEDYYPLRT